jgi:AcrR family transcriptional regulator
MAAVSTPRTRTREPRADALRNHAQLIEAAVAAVHREGVRVPMATIAADAGVGVGTLYRHFPTRGELLEFLTHRSFERLLANAREAGRPGRSAAESLRQFVQAAMTQRNELVLPLHGGPPVTAAKTRALQTQVHRAIEALIARGRQDGTITAPVTAGEIFTFGAMLAQPHPQDQRWEALTRRILSTYLAGLTGGRPEPQ